MRQITKIQHKVLMQLAREEMPIRIIAKRVGVSAGTVVSFRKACATVDALSESVKKKIRRLVWTKTPSLQIASMLGILVEDVKKLRQLDRSCSPPKGASECGECGAKLLDPVKGNLRLRRRTDPCDYEFSSSNFTGLLKVVRNLLDLHDLQIITNPLFFHLAQRAERAYEGLNKKTKSNSSRLSENSSQS